MKLENLTFSNILQKHVNNNPHNLAIEDGVTRMTYEQLDRASNLFAQYLVQSGVKKGAYIVITSNKKVSTIVAIFAILKAGGIYVPVDVDTPKKRLDFILNETEPSFFITDKEYEDVKCIKSQKINDFIEESLNENTDCPQPDVNILKEDYCYVIYTSGSTGKPKGVLITHNNLISFMEGMESIFVMDEHAKCMNTLPYHFDGSIVDTFFPLYMGASVYITPGITIPHLLIQVLLEKNITHFTASASILTLMSQMAKSMNFVDFSSLKYIMTGADVCDKAVMNYFLNMNPSLRIINGYGPTETTCDALTYTITEQSNTSGYFPIGKAMKHIEAVLLTENDTLSNAPNAKGQLLLAGKQLFSGYLKRPEETEKVLKTIHDKTYYFTGDICKIDDKGDFHFIGRADEEIKLNGYRIHLNEIKSAMNGIEGIKGSEIAIINNKKEKQIAIAFEKEALFDVDRKILIKLLKEKLPMYMIPKIFVEFEKFPMLSTSKVDKKEIRRYLEENLKNKEKFYYRFEENNLLEVN